MYDSTIRPDTESETESDTESEEDSEIDSDLLAEFDRLVREIGGKDLEEQILILEDKLADAKRDKGGILFEISKYEQMARKTSDAIRQPGSDKTMEHNSPETLRKYLRMTLNMLKEAKSELAVLTKREKFYERERERRKATLMKNNWDKGTARRAQARRANARRVFGDMDSAEAREKSAREQLAKEIARDREKLSQQLNQEPEAIEDTSGGEAKSSEGLPFRGEPPAFTKPVPGKQQDGYFMGETFLTGENDRCAICWLYFDDTTNGEPVQLNCGHFFHKKCIQRHQSSKFGKINGVPTSWSKECPICRKPFTGTYSDGINRLQNLRF